MPRQSERVRQAILDDIEVEARRQLARDGAAGLSLRSVARELGMVSSGIYRYVDSRDALLTMLIVAGYRRLAEAIEGGRGDGTSREQWHGACAALRAWAHTHPREYALLYGSPVPGYAAPPDTVDPATRVYAALGQPLRASGPAELALDPAFAADGERIAAALDGGLTPAQGVALVRAWAALFGLVSLELFGHTHGVVTDHEAFFTHHVNRLADDLGL